MHIKWNRRLDGIPKKRGIIPFRNDLLNFFKRMKKTEDSYNNHGSSSSSSFSLIFRSESSLKRQCEKKTYIDDSKKVTECYIGSKLENHHTSPLMNDPYKNSTETLDYLGLEKACSISFLNDPNISSKSVSNLEINAVDDTVFCRSDCNISDSLQLSCDDDINTESDFFLSSDYHEVNNLHWALRKEPRASALRTLNGNKITRINCFPRTNTKFISKTSLVQEVKFLTNLCETRKKELNTLEIDLQYATTAFEAVAMLYKHLNEQFDPFSQPFLSEAYEKSKADLQEATEQLLSCQTRLNNIKEIQSREREELVDKLCQIHLTEMNQLKFKHSGELTQMEFQHKKEISTLKENFQSKAEDLRKKNKEMYDTLQEKHKMEKFELERNHEAQLTEIKQQHQVAEDKLTTEVSCLVSQQESLQRQLQNMEDKLMKDKNSIVQRASAEKTALQKEIESLYAVLEIKNQQQRDLQNEQLIWKKQARELHMIKEKVKLFESKTEEQKSLLEKKVKDERSRGLQIQELKKSLKCEENARRNLLMVNEELYYKLQLHTESESLSDNSAYEKNAAIANRSNSLNSLPILPSERCRTLTDVALRYQTNSTSVSMSLSWHPHRPMQKDRIKSKGHSTSHLVTQTNIIPNITQLKKEYCSSSVNQMLLNHPMSMSWGGENFADYFESSDDKNISSENKEPKPIDCKLAKSAFIDSKEVRSNDGNYSLVNRNSKSEVDLDTDKSLSSAISLQSSYTSDSSNSYFAVQPESGDSSSCSQKSKDSDLKDTCDHFMYDDLDPLGVKNPRNLAGESLIQDMNSIVHISKKIHSDIKEELSQIEDNFSSPEEDKHKLSNQISLATPSIDTLSSQGMADSTNLDVSWGDEDIFEKDV